MTETILGKIGIVPKGEWNNALKYDPLDLISYQGDSFLAIVESTVGAAPVAGSGWMLLTAKTQIRKTEKELQYRLSNEESWNSLILLSEIKGIPGSNGLDGKSVELQVSPTHIQWRKVGEVAWIDLVALALLKGAAGAPGKNGFDGKSVELQVSPTHIQWRKIGEVAWVDLVALALLKGIDGAPGSSGKNGLDGKSVELQVSPTHIQWRKVGEVAWVDLVALVSLKGADGAAGAPGKNGLDGKSAYEIEKAAGTFKGTQDEWCAQFEQKRSHLKDTDVHVTAAEKKLWNSSISPLIVNTMQTFYLHSLNKRWVNILGLSVKNSNNSGGLDRANGAEILYQLSAEVTFKLIGNNQEERIAMFTVNIAGSTYAGAGVTTCNIVKHIDNLGVQFSTTATQTIRPDGSYEPGAENNILSAYVDRSVLSSDNSTRIEATIRRTYKQSSLFNESDKNFDDSFISYNYENRKYKYADNTTDQDIAFCKVIEVDSGKGKLDAKLKKDRVWIGNEDDKPTEQELTHEWGVGVTQPGQKEAMGLQVKMVVSDGSSIFVPTSLQKSVSLASAGQQQLLNDAYAGKYYLIKNAVIVARNLSGVSQYPTFSIGNNAAFDNIAPIQTLNTLANGVNAIALTANAGKALIEANGEVMINITKPLIGQGSFIIVLEGVLC